MTVETVDEVPVEVARLASIHMYRFSHHFLEAAHMIFLDLFNEILTPCINSAIGMYSLFFKR